MTNADDTPKVDLGAIKQELDAIEQELGILPTESDVVEERNNPLVDESTPAKRKGTRRDTECRWLDEAENMIQQGETEVLWLTNKMIYLICLTFHMKIGINYMPPSPDLHHAVTDSIILSRLP